MSLLGDPIEGERLWRTLPTALGNPVSALPEQTFVGSRWRMLVPVIVTRKFGAGKFSTAVLMVHGDGAMELQNAIIRNTGIRLQSG